ncbi:hypothetical protein TrRE_jg9485, partial [Triparma retinervis]
MILAQSDDRYALGMAMIEWGISHGAELHPNITYTSSGSMVATGSVLKDSLLLSLPKELCWRLCEPSDSSTGCQMRYVRSVNQHRDDPTHFFGAMLRHLPRTCSGVVCREKDLSLYSQAFWDFTQSEIPEGLSEDE